MKYIVFLFVGAFVINICAIPLVVYGFIPTRELRFSLRTLLLATTLVALALGAGVFLWNGLGDAHPAAVRNDFMSGKITLEQARQELGNNEVSKWTADVHERAKLMRDIKSGISQ